MTLVVPHLLLLTVGCWADAAPARAGTAHAGPAAAASRRSGAPTPFRALDFDTACERAAALHVPVLIYFSETGNVDCARLSALTWVDGRVRAWLARRVISIEVDVGDAGAPAGRFGVRSAPTIVVTTADGRVRACLSGFFDAGSLLARLEHDIRAADRIDASKALLDNARPADAPAARRIYANALEDAGRFEDALEAYRAAFDTDTGVFAHATGVRLLVIQDVGRLADGYEPARRWLVEARGGVRRRLMGGTADRNDPALFAAINTELGDANDTLEAYHRLQREAPNALQTLLLREAAVESLRKLGRYERVGELIDVPRRAELALAQYRRGIGAAPAGPQTGKFRAFARDELIEALTGYYEMLLGAHRLDAAAAVADMVLAEHAGPDAFGALARAGLRTGRPIAANAEQARRAVELAPHPDLAAVTALVAILQRLGRGAEAATVVRAQRRRFEDPADRAALEALVEVAPTRPTDAGAVGRETGRRARRPQPAMTPP